MVSEAALPSYCCAHVHLGQPKASGLLSQEGWLQQNPGPAFSPGFSAVDVSLHAPFPRSEACTLKVNTMKHRAIKISLWYPVELRRGWGQGRFLTIPSPFSTFELLVFGAPRSETCYPRPPGSLSSAAIASAGLPPLGLEGSAISDTAVPPSLHDPSQTLARAASSQTGLLRVPLPWPSDVL